MEKFIAKGIGSIVAAKRIPCCFDLTISCAINAEGVFYYHHPDVAIIIPGLDNNCFISSGCHTFLTYENNLKVSIY
jgi:hypothetical protein